MSKILKPEARKLTPQSEKILRMIKDNGAWMSRAEVAKLMGKKRLNVWDVALLKLLVEQGLLVVEKHLIEGGIGAAWMYKAADEGSE
jgi:Fe2+ or Zn2+ uptake regulation protein